MRQFKEALNARESMQFAVMARRWAELERAMDAQVSLLANEISEMRAAGQVVSLGKLKQMNRYQALLTQMRVEMRRYNQFAEPLIRVNQLEYGRLGIDAALEGVRATYAEIGRMGLSFNRLPIRAVERMVGLTGDGSPLAKLLKEAYPDAAAGITSKLLEATSLGWNPVKTAAAMRDGLAIGLNKSLTIARTEQMRVYRETSRAQFQESGVVTGYKRYASHDACAACLMADGKFYPLDVPFEEHPQGRCTTIPVVADMPPVEWETGREWFMKQDAATQRSILGPGTYDAWRAGKFGLDNIVKRHDDETWGASLVVKPLKELVN